MADKTAPETLQDDALDTATGGMQSTSHRRIQPVSFIKRIDQTSPSTSEDGENFSSSAGGSPNV